MRRCMFWTSKLLCWLRIYRDKLDAAITAKNVKMMVQVPNVKSYSLSASKLTIFGKVDDFRRGTEEMTQIEGRIEGLLVQEEKLVEEGSWLKRNYVKYRPHAP